MAAIVLKENGGRFCLSGEFAMFDKVEDLTRSGRPTNGQKPAAGVVIPSMQSSAVAVRPINGS